MSTHPPKTYDEIVRRTVPEPDSSWRPNPEQERQAYEGFRALDPDERELSDRVHAALAAAGMDASAIKIEIDHDRVLLRGQVGNPDALMKIPGIVGQVEGVHAVVDQLVIAR